METAADARSWWRVECLRDGAGIEFAGASVWHRRANGSASESITGAPGKPDGVSRQWDFRRGSAVEHDWHRGRDRRGDYCH